MIPPGAVDCEQGSQEWFKWRCGCVGASRVADAIAKLKRKDGEAACRRDLKFELVGEILTGRNSEHYLSKWMELGIEREPLARAEYELQNGCYVETVGWVCHPSIKMAGASPDGVIGEDGLLEIKCPKLETHLSYILNDCVPEEYLPQMLWQMGCCDRKWNDFVSYHPDLPDGLQLFVKRLERTKEVDAVIRGMEAEVTQFLSEVDAMVAQIRERNRQAVGA